MFMSDVEIHYQIDKVHPTPWLFFNCYRMAERDLRRNEIWGCSLSRSAFRQTLCKAILTFFLFIPQIFESCLVKK